MAVRVAAVALWLVAWQVGSVALAQPLILPGPLEVLSALAGLVHAPGFWSKVGFSLVRIVDGCALAYAVAGLLAWASAASRTVRVALRPPLVAIKSTPVACVVVLLLIWLGAESVSLAAVFLMALPGVYFALVEGLDHVDGRLAELLRVSGVRGLRRWLALTWPGVLPFLVAASEAVVGMSWKAGVAAELIGTPMGSIGERIYQAKLLLDTAGLFAWTIVVIALATVCGQAISCATVLWYFCLTKGVPMRLRLRMMPLHGETVRLILSLGLASFAVQAGMAAVNFVLNNLLNMYGAQSPIGAEGALASIGVVQRVASFVVLPLIGMSIAIQPLLGFNYGAHLFKRVKMTLAWGIAGNTIIAVVLWALVHLFPVQIVGFFGITDPNLLSFTVFALQVQLFLIPFVGFQIVGSNYFQATGQPAKSVFLSLTRQILFLIPLYVGLPMVMPVWFPGYTGLDALYFACPVADFLAIFTTGVFVLLELKRLRKLENGQLQAKF